MDSAQLRSKYAIYWPEKPELQPGQRFRYGVVVPTFNRSDILRRMLASLRSSDLSDAVIVFVDDASTIKETINQINVFDMPGVPIIRIWRLHNDGFKVHESLLVSWQLLSEQLGCENLVVLDSDTQVRYDWLQRLDSVYSELSKKHRQLILSGFNTFNHETIKDFGHYRLKKSLGGINLFFARSMFESVVRKQLLPDWDWMLVRYCKEHEIPLYCLYPSVIQHIGKYGVYSRGLHNFDWSMDYFGYSFLDRPAEQFLAVLRKIYHLLKIKKR